nr:MAG TPA: hypothetical protein [Bacteriophage sp.]
MSIFLQLFWTKLPFYSFLTADRIKQYMFHTSSSGE